MTKPTHRSLRNLPTIPLGVGVVPGCTLRAQERPSAPLVQGVGDSIGLEFYLSVDAVLLEPLVVTATARGLAARCALTGMEDFQVPTEMINPMTAYPPELLEGVEVYVRPNIPAELLQGGWPCGVVALWTRREPRTGPAVAGWKKVLVGLGVLGPGLLLTR